jgi:hypothetical protein
MGAGEGQLCRGLTDVRVAARHRLLQQRRATLAQLPQLSRATPPHKTSVPTKAAVSQSRNCFCAVCCSGQSTGGAAVTAAQASQRSRVQVRRVRGVRAAQAMMLCVPDRPPAGGAALPQPAAAASTPRQPHWRQHDDCRSHQQDTLTHQSSFFFRAGTVFVLFVVQARAQAALLSQQHRRRSGRECRCGVCVVCVPHRR